MRILTLLLIVVGLAVQKTQGQGNDGSPRVLQPKLMPGDRGADSYTIYSQLLKEGPIEWREVKRSEWLLESTTSAVPTENPCRPNSEAESSGVNPHFAVKAPQDRQAEWNQVLADYDEHCHDLIQLDRDSFKTELPVHLVNPEDTRKMEDPLKAAPVRASGGMHHFSEVFFNPNHTLALVNQGMWCGGLCGNATWVVLPHR